MQCCNMTSFWCLTSTLLCGEEKILFLENPVSAVSFLSARNFIFSLPRSRKTLELYYQAWHKAISKLQKTLYPLRFWGFG